MKKKCLPIFINNLIIVQLPYTSTGVFLSLTADNYANHLLSTRMSSSTNKSTNSMPQTNKHVNPKLNVFTNANKIKQKASLSNSIPISDWTTHKKINHSKYSNSNSKPSTSPQVRPLKNKNKLFITKNRYEVLSQMEQPS